MGAFDGFNLSPFNIMMTSLKRKKQKNYHRYKSEKCCCTQPSLNPGLSCTKCDKVHRKGYGQDAVDKFFKGYNK